MHESGKVASTKVRYLFLVGFAAYVLFGPCLACAQPPLLTLAEAETPSAVETLRQLVELESPSNDRAGLDAIAELLNRRLTELGGSVEFQEAGCGKLRSRTSNN